MRILRVWPFVLTLALVAWVSAASHADEAGWRALQAPGAVALMRHALAPGTGDPDAFRLDDCTTQRNLDARGRAQAAAIGAAIRSAGVSIDAVYTSQWCRCRETAELLGLGSPEPLPSLNSFFGVFSRRDAQTAATEAFVRELPRDQRVMLVTHQVNITALSGVYPASGEIIVLHRGEDGQLQVAGRIKTAH